MACACLTCVNSNVKTQGAFERRERAFGTDWYALCMAALLARVPQRIGPNHPTLPPRVGLPPLVQTAWFLRSPHGFLEEQRDRHGRVFRGRILGFGTGDFVFVADPVLIQDVFTYRGDNLLAGRAAYSTIEPVGGPNSLLVLDPPRHLAERKLLLAPFHGERMRSYRDAMEEETRRAVAAWPRDEPFALRPRFAEIALDIIMRVVFGLGRGERYRALRSALLEVVENDRMISFALMVPSARRDVGPWKPWSRFRDQIRSADALIFREIEDRWNDDATTSREDILSMLILARREDGSALSLEELRDELMTILLAGHETTATALAWTFDQLFAHPHALERVRSEVREAGTDAAPFIDAVIHEALRVRPVIPFVVRMLVEPFTLGEYELPAGTTVSPAIHAVHRDPDLYPEPSRFEPNRFMGRRPGSYEWLPFGGGTRRCLGASFALFEMKTIIETVLGNVDVLPVSDAPERIRRRAFMLVPATGTRAIVRSVGPIAA